MKLRDLESALSDVTSFESPVVELEQYPTSPHLAAHVVHTMDSNFDDIEGKAVCDLGCGTGMLSIAAALSGALFVLGVDIDPSAVAIAADNTTAMGLEDTVQLCLADVANGHFLSAQPSKRKFDTVVMNPPFGTKRKGVDMAFLQTAVQISKSAVYSMHKTSTRDYILRKAKHWGADAKVLAELKFDIGRMYQFHKSNSVDVAVDLWRIDVSSMPDNFNFENPLVPSSDHVRRQPSAARPFFNKKRTGRGSRSKDGSRR